MAFLLLFGPAAPLGVTRLTGGRPLPDGADCADSLRLWVVLTTRRPEPDAALWLPLPVLSLR